MSKSVQKGTYHGAFVPAGWPWPREPLHRGKVQGGGGGGGRSSSTYGGGPPTGHRCGPWIG